MHSLCLTENRVYFSQVAHYARQGIITAWLILPFCVLIYHGSIRACGPFPPGFNYRLPDAHSVNTDSGNTLILPVC
ncbi:hypothetical protein XB02_12610 [Pantoea ananatis]|nr:hypothetical protein XB02_12610 [Pantoea ananatis]KTS28259.1 hypothetical protein NS381_08840 [Pantoea stewartii]